MIDWSKLGDSVGIALIVAGITWLFLSIVKRKSEQAPIPERRNVDGSCALHNTSVEQNRRAFEKIRQETSLLYLRKDIYETKHEVLVQKIDELREEGKQGRQELHDFVSQQFEMMKKLIN